MLERDPLTAILRLMGGTRSWVGIWWVVTNFPDIRLSPMVPVSNRAFALWPLTVMYASRALEDVPLCSAWFEVTVIVSSSWASLS